MKYLVHKHIIPIVLQQLFDKQFFNIGTALYYIYYVNYTYELFEFHSPMNSEYIISNIDYIIAFIRDKLYDDYTLRIGYIYDHKNQNMHNSEYDFYSYEDVFGELIKDIPLKTKSLSSKMMLTR
jgi:hypothetical protein